MNIKLGHYTDADNGMTLRIIPETDAEEEILRAFWRHGEMGTGHPCGGRGNPVFHIRWRPDLKAKKEKE